MQRGAYDAFVDLLSYPGSHPGPLPAAPAISDLLPDTGAAEFAAFTEKFSPLPVHERQELFIHTFDLNPVCSLEMGWHLFGENYDRGLLLVKMRQLLRQHGIPESTELPDHLTHALLLLPRMEREAALYFAEAIVLPSLKKMLEAIRGKESPYEHLLRAITAALHADFPEIPVNPAGAAHAPELHVLA